MQTVYYGISSLLLGILLFFPVRRFMLSLSINRHQRKVKREATVEEQDLLRKKVTPLAAAIAITFAFLFQKVLLMKFFGP
jgi:hypothetical protein